MKKLLFVFAIAGLLTACKSKKAEEKKADDKTATAPAGTTVTEPATTTTATAAASGVPSFSDPEVQKFANDYAAFVAEYKSSMKDPVKFAEHAKSMKDWSARGKEIAMKIAGNPQEAQKWAMWATSLIKELMPEMPAGK